MAIGISQRLAFGALFRTGVTYVSARAYEATGRQAAIFSVVSVLMDVGLPFFLAPFLGTTCKVALARILYKTTSYGAGILATKIFCERKIQWKEAVASTAISNFAGTLFALVFYEFIPIRNRYA
ncbi:MAG TPA: hypothetical protein VHK67_01385 [Rhabdochlamydiaceae bacterium]|jgi:hypothetical protein|nr:hypothetical protein [Rhabdochlamydiaceae bacterium]